jgi:hypothetical protein
MRHAPAAVGMFVLMLGTGCPHAFGKGFGTIDQAAYRDMIESFARNGCERLEVKEECGDEFDECMEDCKKAGRGK